MTETPSLIHRFIALGTGVALAFALHVSGASADFDVTRTDDPSPNGCAPSDCSLREAVIAANTAGGTHELRVSPGATYTLTIPGDSGATVGDLDVGGLATIRITGAKGAPVTINANGAVTFDRAFRVFGKLDLEHVVIAGGVARLETGNVYPGGGIYVAPTGTLEMSNSQLVGNSANRDVPNNGLGGGIHNAGTTTLNNVLLNGNSADGVGDPSADASFGGGFYSSGGTTTITDSVFRSNDAEFGGALSGDGGTVTLNRTRIGRNTADANGGGIFAINGPEFNLFNVNVDNNNAGSAGGLRARDATIRLRNTTVTANVAANAGGISVQDDAGGDDGSIRLANSLIAGNTDIGGTSDCSDATGGQVTTSDYNLIGDVGNCSIVAQPGDQLGSGATPIDARLNTEAPNGGPLIPGNTFFMTNALLAGSPAINAAAPNSGAPLPCESTDARGVPRSLGGRCDIGAYERVKCKGVLVNKVGTDGADSSKSLNLLPTSGADGYLGLGGVDRLRGGGAKDGLCGGGGADKLRGDGGKDKLDGAGGRDKLRGDGGGDLLNGGPGRDICVGGPGKDRARSCEVERSIP